MSVQPDAAATRAPAVAEGKSGLHLHTASAPSGQRVTIMLEELGIPYELHSVALQQGEHLQAEFKEELNPAQLIPVLVDHDAGGLRVFESGAIAMYLLECKAAAGQQGVGGQGDEPPSCPEELLPPPSAPARRAAVLTWMFWMHSTFYAAARRFFAPLIRGAPSTPETQRYAGDALGEQLEVLEGQLQKTGAYVAGDFYSAADISCLPYVLGSAVALSINLPRDLPATHAWVERVLARPAVRRGLRLPAPYPFFSPGPEAEAAVEGLRSKLEEMGVAPRSGKDAHRVVVQE